MNEHVQILKGAAARERGIAACYPVGSPMHTDCQRIAEAYEAAIAALGQGEAEPFAFVDCEGSKVTSCAELVWPRNVSRGKRGARAAWRELPPGLHPLYLHPATKPVVPADTEWREAFLEVSAARYRDAGMKVEQARIHANVDASQLETIWRSKTGAAPTPEAQPQGEGVPEIFPGTSDALDRLTDLGGK